MASIPAAKDMSLGGVMRVGDLVRRPGLVVESRDDTLTEESALFRGSFWHRELRGGLTVHASDVVEEADFVASSAQQAGLFCIFFLEGSVDVEMGGRRFAFRGDGRLRHGTIVSGTRPETFRRLSSGHQRIRHLVVWATPEWLELDVLPGTVEHRQAERFVASHLAERRLAITPRIIALVERLMTPSADASLCDRLLSESAAVEIVAEALSGAKGEEQSAVLSSMDVLRLRRAEAFIEAMPGDGVSVETIARETGVSVSGLQRLFRTAYGESVVVNVRRRRLEEARQCLRRGACTIQQAAMDAGYTSAANFSTAFKREFGYPPGSERHRAGPLSRAVD